MVSLRVKANVYSLLFCIQQGVSELELQFDSLHTAAECCDGVETEISCLERLQLPDLASQCLDTTTGGRWVENCSVESSSSVNCGHGETENSERDCSLSVSGPTSESQEHGLGPPEDRVFPSSNTGRDYCQVEEEGTEQHVVSTQSLSLCDRSEGAQSEAEGESLTVGIQPAAGCGKQGEETDRGEAVIREGQEAAEGKEISEQEVEDSTATRREEETNLESTDLITPSEDTKASVMGQSPSSEGSDVSENSDSEKKECLQEEVGKEEMNPSQDLCDGLYLEEEKTESEGLTNPLSTPGDPPNPSLINCGDVIEGPESAVPCLLIEGLHEGEPPPDINSLEQNQETAVRDYATEQEWGLASETGCHSENFTGTASSKVLDGEDVAEPCGYSIESTSLPGLDKAGNSMEYVRTDPSPETMPSSSDGHADPDSGMTHGISSDDDGSFQSVGSSTTEIYHPTRDSASVEDKECLQEEQSSTEFKLENPNDSKPGEHSLTLDAVLPSEPGTDGAPPVNDCTGTEPESQLSPSLQTMETLNTEGIVEELALEPSNEDLSLGPALSESGDAPTVKFDDSETGEANDSELNAEIEHLASEVISRVLLEACASFAEKGKVIVDGDHPSTGTSDKSAVEKIGDLQLLLQQPEKDNSEMTAVERSADEGVSQSEDQTDASSSHGVTPLSDSADANALEVEPPSPDDEASSDAVDGVPQSAIQGGQALIYFRFILVPHTRIHHRAICLSKSCS